MAAPYVAFAFAECFHDCGEAEFEIAHGGNIAAVARTNKHPPNQRGISITPGAKAKAAVLVGISPFAVHLGR